MSEETKKKNLIDPMIFDEDSPYANKDKKKLINPMTFDVPNKSFEDKIFIVLIYGTSQDSLFDGNYKICIGRTECYRYIQNLVESYGEEIDVHNSKILVETKQTETDSGDTKYYMVNITNALSIYAFCKGVENFYTNDTFSIDNYFEPPKEGEVEDLLIRSKFEDSTSPYATMEDPEMAKIVSDTIKERSFTNSLLFPNVVKASDNDRSPQVIPMIFDDDDMHNV